MKVYRLCKTAFCNDLSAEGAAQFGGRWNSKGVAVLYTGSSPALCLAELMVHLPLGLLPPDFMLVTVEITEPFSRKKTNPDDLSEGWIDHPHPAFTRRMGDHFIRNQEALVLEVPSAVVPGDIAFLINPSHSEFARVKMAKQQVFRFDERLFTR